MATAYDQGPVAQLRAIALFNRSVEGIAIDMADTQLLKFGVNNDAGRSAMRASRAYRCRFLTRVLAGFAPLWDVGGGEKCFAFATKAGHSRAPKDVPQFLTTIGFTLEFSSKIY